MSAEEGWRKGEGEGEELEQQVYPRGLLHADIHEGRCIGEWGLRKQTNRSL